MAVISHLEPFCFESSIFKVRRRQLIQPILTLGIPLYGNIYPMLRMFMSEFVQIDILLITKA